MTLGYLGLRRWTGISLAIIRSVSLRLQNEGQKKLTDCTDAHGVFDTDFFWPLFFDLYLDFIRICKRDRLRLLRKWRNEVRRPKGKPMKNCRLRRLRNKVRRPEGKPIIQFRVYCPKESKCPRTCKIRLKSPLSCQGTIKIKRKSKFKSKRKIKKQIREKTPLHLW